MNETNISDVDLNLLKAFKVLFEERSVSKSAQRLNVSQSAMSHTLARLRKTFNDKLFVRLSNGMEPTDKANELSKKVFQIMHQVNVLLEDQKFEVRYLDATIKIMTHEFIATSYLADIFAKIKKQAPLIKFDVQTYNTNCYELLSNGKIDIVLAAGLDVSTQFSTKLFRTERLMCVVDKRHPAIGDWSIEKVFAFEHIKFKQLDEKHDPVSVFARLSGNYTRNIGMFTDSLDVQPSLLVHSTMIAFLPESLANQGAKSFKLNILPCPFELPKLSINCIWHSSKTDNAKHLWLRNFFE